MEKKVFISGIECFTSQKGNKCMILHLVEEFNDWKKENRSCQGKDVSDLWITGRDAAEYYDAASKFLGKECIIEGVNVKDSDGSWKFVFASIKAIK